MDDAALVKALRAAAYRVVVKKPELEGLDKKAAAKIKRNAKTLRKYLRDIADEYESTLEPPKQRAAPPTTASVLTMTPDARFITALRLDDWNDIAAWCVSSKVIAAWCKTYKDEGVWVALARARFGARGPVPAWAVNKRAYAAAYALFDALRRTVPTPTPGIAGPVVLPQFYLEDAEFNRIRVQKTYKPTAYNINDFTYFPISFLYRSIGESQAIMDGIIDYTRRLPEFTDLEELHIKSRTKRKGFSERMFFGKVIGAPNTINPFSEDTLSTEEFAIPLFYHLWNRFGLRWKLPVPASFDRVYN